MAVFESSFAPEMKIRSSYYPADDFFEIQGSKGTVWVTRCHGEMFDFSSVIVHTGSESTLFQVPSDWQEGFKGASKDFIDGIIQGYQPAMDIQFSKEVLQTALAVYRPTSERSPVDPSTIGE